MPRTTRHSSYAIDNNQSQEDSSAQEESSSEQEQDQEVLLQPSQAQLIPNMFMPYSDGPKMDWTVNDGLYHRFLKWHLNTKIF